MAPCKYRWGGKYESRKRKGHPHTVKHVIFKQAVSLMESPVLGLGGDLSVRVRNPALGMEAKQVGAWVLTGQPV